ncbi:MAG: lamin tail domain-containing protein [Verrucomicrobiales bacterium]|nr:lamin tail domain-containing protein [Verrucomicrobiales bacterium]
MIPRHPNARQLAVFALAAALAITASAIDSVVVFNEIHYQPAGDDSSLEYVELYSQMTVDVDLSNWRIHGGITYDFPEGTTIPGGGYLVVAKNPAALAAATGITGALGPFDGQLDNGGERLRLYSNGHAFRSLSLDSNGPAIRPDSLWSVDLQGDGAGGAFGQLAPPNLQSGTEINADLGNVWNAFSIPGHSGTATDPSLPLVDSAGEPSPLTFAVDGRVTGWSANGNALTADYLFVNAGNADTSVTWSISGLDPSKQYAIHFYGGITRNIKITLEDTRSVIAAAAGTLIEDIGPAPDGTISGTAERGTLAEGNWSGLQIYQQDAVSSPPVGVATSSLKNRRVMDQLDYADNNPWPVGPDGSGFTLAKTDARTATGEPTNWSTSATPLGTPGAANTTAAPPTLTFNELSAAGLPSFQLELHNPTTSTTSLTGLVLASSDPLADDYTFPANSLAADTFLTLDTATLGFSPEDNDRLFLYSPDRSVLIDTVRLDDQARARVPDSSGPWLNSNNPTFGTTNQVAVSDAIVINEIFYHAFPQRSPDFHIPDEEWIELTNRSPETVDLTGWSVSGGIRYDFPENTLLEPGAFLVVANSSVELRLKHPAATIIGDFSGGLGNGGDTVVLRDSLGNTADHVRYYDEGRWHKNADGGGSSLELRDPDADNSNPAAWSASDSSAGSEWRTYSYRQTAVNNGQGKNAYQEFLLGFLDAGELLLDDVSVIEYHPTSGEIEFLQNGDFESDTPGSQPDKWRCVGTHGSHGRTVVVNDPDSPGNKCLHVVSTGPTEDKHNKIETTFSNNERVNTGRDYRITFRAKWLSGTDLVNTRLYFDYLPLTHALQTPETWGTPGAVNSTAEPNIGPTFAGFGHSPAVPDASRAVTVSVKPSDPDGVAALTLFYNVNGAAFQQRSMSSPDGGTTFTGTIPGQSASRIVRFYVRAQDTLGGTSFHPPRGPAAGAFYKVQDRLADRTGRRRNLRIIMDNRDRNFIYDFTNRLSNDRFPATVILDESRAFYDVGLRLKGSAFGRFNGDHHGFNIEFHPDDLYRGIHATISIERSPPPKELLAKHLMTRAAGGVGHFYDDVVFVIPPNANERGTELVSMARYTSLYWDGVFPDVKDSGTLFNLELLYNPNGTNGGPEGLKRGNPYNHDGGRYELRDRGTDKEPYRWGFQIRSNRERDDYTQIIALNRVMRLRGNALRSAIEPLIDVDQWMRTLAQIALNGTDDIYSRIWEHNFRFYVRPTDKKIIILQWDLDRSFNLSTSSSLTPDRNNVRNLFTIPAFQRQFDAHVLDLVQTTFNADYVTPWAAHLGFLASSSFSSQASYVRSRANFALSRLPAEIPFRITTNSGNPFSVASTSTTLQGEAWIDVHTITINGNPADLTWVDGNTWQITVPLASGANTVNLTANNLQGTSIASASTTITNTSSTTLAAADNLAVSEIHYNPAAPSQPELDAGGSTDPDNYEFIELHNTSTLTVDLANTSFTDGITFTFPTSTTLPPGGYAVLVSDPSSFTTRHPGITVSGTYSGNLRNSGESLTIKAADTTTIANFTYNDNAPWPASADGGGYSLTHINPTPGDDAHGTYSNWRTSSVLHGTPRTTDATTITAWLASHGLAGSDPLGDADGDGLSLLLEYAFNLDPAAASPNPALTLTITPSGLSFPRNLTADDLVFTIQSSPGLKTWTDLTDPLPFELINNSDATATMATTLPAAVAPTQYLRISVTTR